MERVKASAGRPTLKFEFQHLSRSYYGYESAEGRHQPANLVCGVDEAFLKSL